MQVGKAARWLPKDFVVASQVGGLYTIMAYVLMLVLFVCELRSFLGSSYSTMLMLDDRSSDVLQINFDVDLYDLECRNLRLEVFTQSDQENVAMLSRDFWLRSIDDKGRTFGMAIKPEDNDRPDEEHAKRVSELIKEDGKAEIDADWSSSHDGFKHKSFEHVIEAHDFTLINFFAEWCSHCREFTPRWNEIANKLHGDGARQVGPYGFADRDGVSRNARAIKMNCVDFKDTCHEKGIDAYPTIRLYKADGTFSVFEGRREEAEIIKWMERTVKMKSYGWAKNHEAFERGCNAKGRFQVPRVPGHLELMAGGGDQQLNSRMTNVSHVVKHLSFSDPDDGRYHRKSWGGLPAQALNFLSPLDGKVYVTKNFHEAYSHELKVVSTVSQRGARSYQFSHASRIAKWKLDEVPQARFHFDIEPFSVHYRQDEKRWYDFATSILAMMGGLYVILRLFSQASTTVVTAAKATIGGGRRMREGMLDTGHLD